MDFTETSYDNLEKIIEEMKISIISTHTSKFKEKIIIELLLTLKISRKYAWIFKKKKNCWGDKNINQNSKHWEKKRLNNNKTNNDTQNGVVLLNIVKFMTFDNYIHNLKTCML